MTAKVASAKGSVFFRPSALWTPEYLDYFSAWFEHGPFAFWLTDVLRPRCFVELGTHAGYSYFSFCQAVQRLHLGTSCYAVDTWTGDEHSGLYGEDVFHAVAEHNQLYTSFSTLIRSTFDDALGYFPDKSIDLLHIDGRHFYEDVCHDFESWRGKLTEDAIILFHDTNVRERQFGVWKLFEELKQNHPTFEFMHGHGLGMVALNKIPPVLKPLFAMDAAATNEWRQAFATLGNAVTRKWQTQLDRTQLQEQIASYEQERVQADLIKTQLQEQIANYEQERVQADLIKTQLQDMAAHRSLIESSLDKSEATLVKYRDDLTSVQEEMKITRTKLLAQQQDLQSSRNELLACKNEFMAIGLDLENSKNELDAVWKSLAKLSDGFRQTKQSSFWHKMIWGESPRNVPNMDTVLNSPLFDKNWYIAQNPDVAQAGLEPAKHYCDFGTDEGRQPGPLFDGVWYLTQNPDVASAKINPLVHFMKYGWGEGRSIRTVVSGRMLKLQLSENQTGLSTKYSFAKRFISTIKSIIPKRRAARLFTNSEHRLPDTVLILPIAYSLKRLFPVPRVAVILHVYYIDTIKLFKHYLSNIPFPFALFISTDTEEKKKQIERDFAGWQHGSVEVRITVNRGRDIAPKLISFRELYDKYPFILHIHSKKSTHTKELRSWLKSILEDLLKSSENVESIFEAFHTCPDLGMIAPRNFYAIRPFINWDNNFEICRSIAQRMGITLNGNSPIDFPAGSMFWARSAALQPILDLNLSFDDFPEESGKKDGTMAHAIERLYFYIVEQAGFKWIHAGDENTNATEKAIRIERPDDFKKLWPKNCSKLLLPESPVKKNGNETLYEDIIPGIAKNIHRQKRRDRLTQLLNSASRISLPVSDEPEVSVILVLYNNAELTLEALRSLQYSVDVLMEIIIVDNASSDRTQELCDRIDGATIIRNTDNLHYLRAVNQASTIAMGKFVLLLNNDAYVAHDAIGIARNTLLNDPEIGGVGGKIVLLDGTLQEAGSIIWQDGSCLGYGRGRDPNDAEFQFRRDVDYCSGAFLLLRQQLFKNLNWFDETFAPAYYEETDLCMRIRAAGYRLVYDPGVVVKHFEFGSSTTSEAALALQKRNHTIFEKKHRPILVAEHLPPTTRPLEARMRSRHPGRLLLIDDRLPYPSLGAGYPRANSIVEAIHSAGWFITYYPLNFPNVSWTDSRLLFPDDIEIMADYGTYGLEEFLSSRVGYYDLVFVSRPHNMDLFKKARKNLPGFFDRTKLIYDAEAVFSSREEIRRNLKGYSDSKAINAKNFEKEISLVENATAIIAVSEKEAELFRNASKAKVHVLGHSVKAAPTHTLFELRKDILFVGALDDNDSPNVDSLVWFIKDVMPILDSLLDKNYVLKVIGRNGSQEIQALAGERIQLLGRVEDIRPYYESSRFFIAPTRFSAGIPMKVHEAAAAGLPVVATSQLAEQLGWQNNVELLIADQPSDFATACHSLYTKSKVWEHVRSAALMRIEQECDPSRFATQVANILAECAPKRSR